MSASESVSARIDERELISKAKGGDRTSLRSLVDLHKDRLHAFIWRMTRNTHDAEEICQEAFLKAFASLETFSSEFRFSTWLFTIGYRVCLNRMRRRRIVGTHVELNTLPDKEKVDAETMAESAEAEQLRGMVWGAVDRLTPPQRATILLFYRHEFGCHEIARVLELPLATVKSHLHRARARLREMLESAGFGNAGEFRNLADGAG